MKSTVAPPLDSARELPGSIELRAADENGGMPRLTGYMLRFNEWTTINSAFEGHFRESIAPGATRKTMQENRDRIKILFNHGKDPSIGEKPIAPTALIEDERGVRYDDPEIIDTRYNRDELVPLLKAGVLGSSFRFHVEDEEWNDTPERSEQNPEGLPERTIRELRLYEGGPVVFPAYANTGNGARSFSYLDTLVAEAVRRNPDRVTELLESRSEDMERLEEIERRLADAGFDRRSVTVAIEGNDLSRLRAEEDEGGESGQEQDGKPIPYMATSTDSGPWDGPAVKAAIPGDLKAADLRKYFAWEDPSANLDTKDAYKFLHHDNGTDGKAGAANLTACSAGIAVLNGGRAGTTIPDANRKGVYDHLAGHLKAGGKEAPPLRSVAEIEAEERSKAEDQHSTGAEVTHSTRGRKKLYGVKNDGMPSWRLP